MKLQMKREGKFWTTRIMKQALEDLKRYGVPDHAAQWIIEGFHELGDWENPEDGFDLMQIRRGDVPQGVYRLKISNPPALLQCREIVFVLDGNTLALAGVFIRDKFTYESTLTRRLCELGLM
jgi:hypothetical protein